MPSQQRAPGDQWQHAYKGVYVQQPPTSEPAGSILQMGGSMVAPTFGITQRKTSMEDFESDAAKRGQLSMYKTQMCRNFEQFGLCAKG